MKKKVAIIYDWLDKWGGVERVLLALHETYPQADFFTSYYDKKTASWAKNINIKTSFLQKFPGIIKKNRVLSFVFFPFAFESFNFSGYDLVISVTSSFAKGIIVKPGTKHICYLLTPTRYLWIQPKNYLTNKFIKFLLTPYFNHIKKWDYTVAQRPDKIISISQTVADRCRKYYKRQSEVIYPPFDEKYWKKISLKFKTQNLKLKLKTPKYFLTVSRLERYKKIDLVIRLFNQLDKNLIVVGEGSQEKKLRKIAYKNIRFYSKLTDEELAYLYNHAQALIMPQEEDFGYVALEANFFNCPVVAYKKGGVCETVVENKTGIFFDQQTESSLASALERLEKISYNVTQEIDFKKFSKNEFVNNFRRLVE